jgi:hypothetical protein
MNTGPRPSHRRDARSSPQANEKDMTDMKQPQNDDADHQRSGYRPPNVVIDITWLDKFLRDAIQRNGAALAEMHQARDRQGSARTADPQLEDREAEP